MFARRRLVSLAAPTLLVGAGLTVAAAVPSASENTIACDADEARLVIGNGSAGKFFECRDEDAGEIQQFFASDNPWRLSQASTTALFADPTATDGKFAADGYVFNGSQRSIGVAKNGGSPDKFTIDAGEVLTLRRDALDRRFDAVTLGVDIVADGTTIEVRALGSSGSDSEPNLGVDDDGPLEFFMDSDDDDITADGFEIEAVSGSFTLSGDFVTIFSLAPPTVQTGEIGPTNTEIDFDTTAAGVSISTQASFLGGPDCNVTGDDLVSYRLEHFNLNESGDLVEYKRRAQLEFPAPTDVFTKADGTTQEVGDCLIEWTTTATGVQDLDPLIDFDNDGPLEPVLVRACGLGEPLSEDFTRQVQDLGGDPVQVRLPLSDSERKAKQLLKTAVPDEGTNLACLVAGAYDGANGIKVSKSVTWNDPSRFG